MQYLPKNDLSKLFRVMHAKSFIHHQIALLAFFTGTRISQALNVRGEDIFQKDGKWVILIRAAKRGNIVVHSLHVDQDPAFDMTPLISLAATKGQSLVFGGTSRQYFNLRLKHYGELAGIHSSYLHSHVFRHSVAVVIFDKTQRIGAVSQFLGHRSPSSAFVYLKENSGRRAQEAVDSLQLA